MPSFRETPYSAFNFLVELPGEDATEIVAGFAEVSGLSAEITVAEYRAGNAPVNYVSKIPGIHKAGDVTLKRGVIGATNMWAWLNEARRGSPAAKKDSVTIKLLSEDRSEVVVTWVLRGVTLIKWTGPTLTAKGGGDVAMEEMALSVETIEEE